MVSAFQHAPASPSLVSTAPLAPCQPVSQGYLGTRVAEMLTSCLAKPGDVLTSDSRRLERAEVLYTIHATITQSVTSVKDSQSERLACIWRNLVR